MAGIYIPGLEMLKCDECFWCIGHRIKCPAGSKDVLLGGRHPDCPLASVPPHGRLGDLDALHKLFLEKAKENKGVGGAMVAMAALCIANAPTIIPADPAEEGES